MNIVIYARYSSDNQREESIEGQLRECKAYAQRKDMTIIGTYIDRAFSAKTDQRPDFQKMIKDSDKRKFEGVLVWKLDRFARNRYDSAHYKRILKNNGVKVISATEALSDSPESILLESLLEGLSEYYSADLAEKVTRGHTDNALKDMFNGGPPPFGYYIDKDLQYRLHPKNAPIVKEIFQRYADGEGITTIADDLNSRGLRSGRGQPFNKRSFQTLFRNRRYLGEYRYRDIVHQNAIPSIIDEELFEKVQRRRNQNRQAPAKAKAKVAYILTGKIYCSHCGTTLIGESGKSKTGVIHHYYKCSNRKRYGSEVCTLKALRKEVIEKFVVEKTIEIVLNDRILERLTDIIMDYAAQENSRLPALQNELQEVQKRIRNLVSAIEQGIITPSTKSRMEELEVQRQDLEIAIYQEELKSPDITREMVQKWFYRFRSGDLSDPEFQKQVIDCFVNRIYVFDDKLLFTFHYKENSEPLSHEEAVSSILDDNGSLKNRHPKGVPVF